MKDDKYAEIEVIKMMYRNGKLSEKQLVKNIEKILEKYDKPHTLESIKLEKEELEEKMKKMEILGERLTEVRKKHENGLDPSDVRTEIEKIENEMKQYT